MNRFIIFIVSFITIFNFCFSQIETEISLNKNEFLEAEPIIFSIKFKNNSSLMDSINTTHLDYYWYINFECDSDKVIEKNLMTVSRIGITYQKLQPQQEIVYFCNLIQWFGDVSLKYSLLGGCLYLSEGKYTIKFEIRYSDFRIDVKPSNEIVFLIYKPKDRDLEAFQKLIRAYEINDGNPWIMDSILLKRAIYYEVAKNYLESPYSEEAIFRYNEETEYLKVDTLDIDLDKYFVEKYPESYFMVTVLNTLSKGIYKFRGGEVAVIDYLIYIIQNFSNFGVSNIAKVCLQTKNYLN